MRKIWVVILVMSLSFFGTSANVHATSGNLSIESGVYTVDNDTQTVSDILLGTPVEDFLGNFEDTAENLSVYYKGERLQNTARMIEGARLRIGENENATEYTLIYRYHFNEDFEKVTISERNGGSINKEISNPYANYRVTRPSGNSATLGVTSYNTINKDGKNSLCIGSNGQGSQTGNMQVSRTDTSFSDGPYLMAAEMSIHTDTDHNIALHFAQANGFASYASPIFFPNGGSEFRIFQEINSQISCRTDGWNHVAVIFDQNTGRCKGYLNGIPVYDEVLNDVKNLGKLTQLKYRTVMGDAEKEVYIDNLKVFDVYDINYYDYADIHTSIENITGTEYRLQPQGNEITHLHMQLTGKTAGDFKDSLVLKGSATAVILEDDTLAADNTPLAEGMVVRITAGDAISYHDYLLTENPYIDVKVTRDGNKYLAIADILNPQEIEIKPCLILTESTPNRQLEQVVIKQQSGAAIVYALQEEITVTGTNHVKVMLWDGLEHLVPLSKSYNNQ